MILIPAVGLNSNALLSLILFKLEGYYTLKVWLEKTEEVSSKRHVEDPLIWPGTVEAKLYQQVIAERLVKRTLWYLANGHQQSLDLGIVHHA